MFNLIYWNLLQKSKQIQNYKVSKASSVYQKIFYLISYKFSNQLNSLKTLKLKQLEKKLQQIVKQQKKIYKTNWLPNSVSASDPQTIRKWENPQNPKTKPQNDEFSPAEKNYLSLK